MSETVAVALITAVSTLLAGLLTTLIAQNWESRRAASADRRERLASVRDPLASAVVDGKKWAWLAIDELVGALDARESPSRQANALDASLTQVRLLMPERGVADALSRIAHARSQFESAIFFTPVRGGERASQRPEHVGGVMEAANDFFDALDLLQSAVSAELQPEPRRIERRRRRRS